MSEEPTFMDRYKLEGAENWRGILNEVPALNFPRGWSVKVIPPFAGAVARFIVEKGSCRVSVYLDWYDRLGSVGQPYWEMHPNTYDDCDRFLLNETEEPISSIRKSLAWQKRTKLKDPDQ